MAITQEMIIAAWKDQMGSIEKTLPGAVVNSALPDQRTSVRDLGLCNDMNQSGSGTTFWSNKGVSTLDLFDLKITRFEGVGAQDPTFPRATGGVLTVLLPIGF